MERSSSAALCREETVSVRTQAGNLVVMAARVGAAGGTSSARWQRATPALVVATRSAERLRPVTTALVLEW